MSLSVCTIRRPLVSPSTSSCPQQLYYPSRCQGRRRGFHTLRAEEAPQEVATAAPVEPQLVASAGPVCQACGISMENAPRGCDGQGRIAGGLGAVMGFDWWPIKAYRPCPAGAQKGVRYKRKGQITDEMLWGRGSGQKK